MVSSNRLAGALVCAALLAPPATALAGDFVDTRLTLLFSDDDMLHGAGETNPSSPAAGFGARPGSLLFFDNYDTKYTGFETLSNLVLYKKDTSYFKNLETEGALALTMLVASGDVIAFQDASSYLRVNYKPDSWGENDGLSFTGFPVSSDRFRLGYSYRLSWAGSRIFPGAGLVPGAKVQLTRGPVYVYTGLKTAQLFNADRTERETNYGVLGGAGWDILDTLRWEVGGGFFQRGVLGKPGVEDEPAEAAGISSQVSWHVGQPIGTSVDFKLYKNDPDIYQRFFQPDTYAGGVSYTISAEATYLEQTLQDADLLASTTRQGATAGDLQAKVKIDYTRIHFTAMYRDLPYILFNVPSLVPFQDLPDDADVEPEFFAAAGVDYYLENLHLTPGVIVGVQLPAAVTTNVNFFGTNPADVSTGTRTLVVRDEGRFSILPADEEPELIFSVKGTLRLDLSDSMSAAGELFYSRDPNRATIADNSFGDQPVRVFEDPDQLGFNLLLQARF